MLIIVFLWAALFPVPSLSLSLLPFRQLFRFFYGFTFMSHILDDFIFLGPADSTMCAWQLHAFLHYASLLGIPIKHSKTVQLSIVAIVHGIEIDSCALQARLPRDKLSLFYALVLNASHRCSVHLDEWQSLTGSLSFAS